MVFVSLVQSAPTSKSRDQEFNEFFNKMSEEVMENAENEMKDLTKMEDEFFQQFSGGQNLQTNGQSAEATGSTQKRTRRSVSKVVKEDFEDSLSPKRSKRSAQQPIDELGSNQGEVFETGRSKRSVMAQQRAHTMSRSSYRRMLFMRRSRQVICHRRCLWRKMYFLCRYGIELDEPCICE